MQSIHPQFITDADGKDLVVLSKIEFDLLMEELDELEDIRLYDLAKKNDSGERIPMDKAFELIESNRNLKK